MSSNHNSAVSYTHVMRVPPELDVCIVHVSILGITNSGKFFMDLSLHPKF